MFLSDGGAASLRHSGFNLDASVRIGARDERGRESISRYIIRAPFSVGKLRYLPGRNTVIYKSRLVKGLNRNFGLHTPLDFLAAVTAHIPDAWEHLARYHGWYSSVHRGKRVKAGLEERSGEPVTIADESPGAKVARRNWAQFISLDRPTRVCKGRRLTRAFLTLDAGQTDP